MLSIDTDKATGAYKLDKPDASLAPGLIPAKKRKNVYSKIGEMIPYASNIANAFRRPPTLGAPRSVAPVSAGRINLSNQRQEVERSIRGANAAADRGLSENDAAAVRAANLATGIRGINAVNQAEANENVSNQRWAAQMNAGIDAQNTAMWNRRQEDNVGAAIANQREQSANLANAADKIMAQRSERDQAALDEKRLSIYSRLWSDSKVFDRFKTWAKENGITDLTGTETYTKKANGGPLDPGRPVARQGTFRNRDSNLTAAMDGLNYNIINGGDPLRNPYGRTMFDAMSSDYGRDEAQQVVTNLHLFRQRPDVGGMNADQRLELYHRLYPSRSTNRLRLVGGSPAAGANNSTDIGVNPMASRKYGGRIKVY